MTLSTADQSRLERFWQHCVTNQYFNIGYPESADFDYSQLHRFLRFSINNCGDWNEYSNYLLNSFDFEKDVMTYFSELFNIALEDSWGYVTNGGTVDRQIGKQGSTSTEQRSALSPAAHRSRASALRREKRARCVAYRHAGRHRRHRENTAWP